MKTAVRRESYRGFESHTLRSKIAHPGVLVVALLAVAAALALVVVTGRVLDVLLLCLAVCAMVAVEPERRGIWGFQAAVLVLLCLALLLTGISWPVTAAIAVQVCIVVAVADIIAQRLSRVRGAEQRALRDAERRRALLEAARQLPHGNVEEAEFAVVRTLRALAFDAAAVARIDGDVLMARAVDGMELMDPPLRRGQGLAWRAIEEDRTIAMGDYEQAPDAVVGRHGLRGIVVTPVRSEGRTVGVLVGARVQAHHPSAEEIEVAEVMAAHLGSMLTNRAIVDRQQLLLEQAAHLDRIGQSLLEAVSEEVRDPLTVVRLGAQLLSQHEHELDAAQRAGLLTRLRRESEELRLVIDTILDFTRFHARRAEPHLDAVPVSRILATCGIAAEDGSEAVPRQVMVDQELLLPALRLLLASGAPHGDGGPAATTTVQSGDTEVTLTLHRRSVGHASSVLVHLAVQLLLAAGGRLALDEDTPAVRIHLPLVDHRLVSGGRT